MRLYIFFLGVSLYLGATMQENFYIIYDLSKERRDELYLLYKKMWWSNTRTLNDINIILDHSLPIGLVDKKTDKLIGFTRIVSDHFKYAFIFDVLLDESYRNKGLGRLLMEKAINHPDLKKVSIFELHCLDNMVPFYEKFGFKEDFENLIALRLNKTTNK